MTQELLQSVLNGGVNVGSLALLVMIWRHEIRLVRLETKDEARQ